MKTQVSEGRLTWKSRHTKDLFEMKQKDEEQGQLYFFRIGLFYLSKIQVLLHANFTPNRFLKEHSLAEAAGFKTTVLCENRGEKLLMLAIF